MNEWWYTDIMKVRRHYYYYYWPVTHGCQLLCYELHQSTNRQIVKSNNIATLLADRELSTGCYLFTISDFQFTPTSSNVAETDSPDLTSTRQYRITNPTLEPWP